MAVRGGMSSVHAPSNFSRSLERIFDEAQITSELRLCGRKLKEYPKGALKYNLSDTVIADLSKNRFSELPSDICTYLSLEELRLDHNVLKTLPDHLASLQSLTHLILSRNQLSVLPACVCQLTSLQVLDVSGNRLVSLPEELGLLTKLTELDASYNQLQVLPPSVGDLDDLRRLRLRRNLLQNAPTELCFLRLVSLDLSYNRITSLPTELRFMTSLLELLLEANPLSHPPANICMRGRVHIFKWLDQSAAKEDKKRGVLSEVEFRKSRKYTRSAPTVADFRLVNGFLDGRPKRSTVDSGYSTSENGDPRWSHDSQELFDPMRSDYCKDTRSRSVNAIHSHSAPSMTSYCTNGMTNGAMKGLGNPADGSGSMTSSSEHTISGHSTPSTLSPGDSFNLEDEFYKAMKLRDLGGSATTDQNGDDFSHRRTGPEGAISTSSVKKKTPTSIPNMIPHPHNPDPGGGGSVSVVPSPSNPHAPVPTYREYLEAKRQQRALETNNIYRRPGGDGISPTSEQAAPVRNPAEDTLALHSTSHSRPNSTSAPVTKISTIGSCNSSQQRPTDLHEDSSGRLTRAQVKSIQKEAVLSYVKSRVSPCKSPSGSPNSSFDSNDALPQYPSHSTIHRASHYSQNYPTHQVSSPGNYSPINHPQISITYSGTNGSALPISGTNQTVQKCRSHSTGTMPLGVLKSRKKSGGGLPFDPDSTPSRHNFTYRRELEKQQHEKQLIDSLRNIIETRLKVSLPSDLPAALMDGVVLCHLVNHVRPRAVSSIHVPSPAVPKLTIAKCRLNVENFLDACRKIGVEEEYSCSVPDILEERGTVRVAITVERLLQFYQGRNTPSGRNQTPV